MEVGIHDHTRCLLGECPLWHPERGQLYWCDILSRRVLTCENGGMRSYEFDTYPSALGWVDKAHMLVALKGRMELLNLDTGATEQVCALEADTDTTRSNDGRADPWGGFWIGTMGIGKEDGAGSIYRILRGRPERLLGGLTIANAICFSPDRRHAYFTDTPTQIVMRLALDGEGWPAGDPEPFIDETAGGHNPDGAVCDAEGRLWVSHWGSSRVAIYSADGCFESEFRMPAMQITCPAFGGPNLSTLYVTSAAVGLDEIELTRNPQHGRTFVIPGAGRGQAEHRVIL